MLSGRLELDTRRDASAANVSLRHQSQDKCHHATQSTGLVDQGTYWKTQQHIIVFVQQQSAQNRLTLEKKSNSYSYFNTLYAPFLSEPDHL